MSTTALKELMILSVVRAHPAHGYAVAEMLEASLGWSLGLGRSTVYATLSRFEKRGWISGHKVDDSNFPERDVYSLTEKGGLAYFELLAKCASSPPPPLSPMVAFLSYLDDLDPAHRKQTLHMILDSRRTLLAKLVAFPPHPGSAGAALNLSVDQLNVEIGCLEDLLAAPELEAQP